jgi:glycosyltransferase involved in cell wall biosynthesis
MKILHINPVLGAVGGTEVYISQLIGDMRERGHEAEVIAEKDITKGTVAPFHFLGGISDIPSRWTTDQARRFRHIVNDVAPDLIQLHNVLCADLVAEAARLRPTVRTVHDHTLFCPGLNKEFADGGLCDRPMGRYCLERYEGAGCYCLVAPKRGQVRRRIQATQRLIAAHRNVRRFLVSSRFMERELARVDLKGEQITFAPYYASPRVRWSSCSQSPPLVIAVSRMVHPDKGIRELLDALRLITVPFRAILVGDGQDLAMLRQHCRDLGLDETVEFCGWMDHERAVELMASARVIAFPSMWNEPFGLVGIEAMAVGRPVVAFDVGGVGEWLVSGQTGMLIPRGEIAAFAAAVTRLLMDAALAAEYGAAGAQRVQQSFSKKAHLDIIENVYREATIPDRTPQWLKKLRSIARM